MDLSFLSYLGREITLPAEDIGSNREKKKEAEAGRKGEGKGTGREITTQ